MAQARATSGTTGAVVHWAFFYDVIVWLMTFGREQAFRDRLLDLARLGPGESVLDVGCGTGSLAIAAHNRVGPGGAVSGIDPAPEMIARANKKARKAGVEITFKEGVAEALPFPDAHFNVVMSTLMLHHIPRNIRAQCVAEMRRVVKPGGRVLIVDFAGSEQKKRGFLAHFRSHGNVKLQEILALLGGAGLSLSESGQVGFRNMQFVLGRNAPA